MRKLFKLGLAVLIAASGLSMAKAADAVEVIPCDPAPLGQGFLVDENAGVHPGSLGVTIPNAVPVLGGTEAVGPEGACAELERTLVFVGTANISNGVNFAGSYNNDVNLTDAAAREGVADVSGTYEFPFGTLPALGSGGICAMVDWNTPTAGVSSPVPTVTDCNFVAGGEGSYGGPGAGGQTPIIQQLTADSANGGLTPLGPVLRWDPTNQPSCFDSDGSGQQSFTAKMVNGPTETWSSSDDAGNPGDFSWDNGLDNLRGHITNANEGTFDFDAKIEAHAAPDGALQTIAGGGKTNGDVFDSTDAGCLQKNLVKLAGPAAALSTSQAVGLNYILIAGTSSWRVIAPEVLGG